MPGSSSLRLRIRYGITVQNTVVPCQPGGFYPCRKPTRRRRFSTSSLFIQFDRYGLSNTCIFATSALRGGLSRRWRTCSFSCPKMHDYFVYAKERSFPPAGEDIRQGFQPDDSSIQAGSRSTVSLEPGPSRARYFPREMLLLTTTARERAWRLLKITNRAKGRNSTSILHVPLSLLTRLYMANRSYNVMKVFSFSSRV